MIQGLFKRFFKSSELLLGFVIWVITFLLLYHSSLSMIFSCQILVMVTAVFLIALLINLSVITQIPHHGKLRMITKDDKIFEETYEIIFFSIYFCLATIVTGLLAEVVSLDRAQSVLLVSMFVTTVYNIIISIWLTHGFIKLSDSVEADNAIHKIDDDNDI